MINLGDITKISGYNAPTVDVVIGGSPCQDLSVAGKRAGLAGERSGLYMEQIRIIKEMREHDQSNGRAAEFIRPRYMVWENVPGAFSSNHGKDFAAVLEEAVRVIEPEAPHVPVPEKGWPTSGCLMGDRWSVAWRVLDAQFWGVPQRRRRIALVADFGGHTAPEILFVRESMSGDSEPGGTEGKGFAGSVKESTGSPVWCLQGNGIDRADTAGCNGKGWTEGKCYTLNTIDRPAVCAGFSANLGAKAHGIGYMDEQSPTLSSQRHDASVLCLNDQDGSVMGVSENVSGTIRSQEHGGFAGDAENGVRAAVDGVKCLTQWDCQSKRVSDPSGSMRTYQAMGDGGANNVAVCYSFDALASNSMKSANSHSGCREVEVSKTLDTTDPNPSKNQGGIAIVQPTLCMNDQGGSVMSVSENVSGTIRSQEHGGFAGDAESGTSFAVRIRGGCDGGGKGALVQTEASGTLGCRNDQVVFCFQGNGIDRADTDGCNGKGWRDDDVSFTLNTIDRPAVYAIENHPADSRVKMSYNGVVQTLSSRMGTGGGNVPMCIGTGNPEIAGTLDASYYKGTGARNGNERTVVCAVDCRNGVENPDINGTLQSKPNGGMSLNLQNVVRECSFVRRLTPLECERLQGFPCGWTDIGDWVDSKGKKRKTTDSARYKALGNSIALPPWKWVLKRLSAQYERDATMASLFDGIGGFPLIWEQLNGIGSCLWASEIDEFPIAVTKKRFGKEQ